jgi:hypothetical protein
VAPRTHRGKSLTRREATANLGMRSETLMNPDIDLKVFWQPG